MFVSQYYGRGLFNRVLCSFAKIYRSSIAVNIERVYNVRNCETPDTVVLIIIFVCCNIIEGEKSCENDKK